nr:hypothetical protein [Treponema sp. OMZ 799]
MNFYFNCRQLNHLLSRTAIEAKILFAVCVIKKQALTGGKSFACEDKYSKKIGAALVQQADRRSFEASAVPALVYFYIIMIVHKCQQSAAQSCLGTFELRVLPFGKTSGGKLLDLLNNPTDRTFENRRSRYKELGKKVPQAYRVYVEDTFLPCDAGDARIFSKEETGLYYYGARYLDPKYSRWLSGDPALNDYIPKAPINDEAKKHNENLPGMGGVFNTVNLHVYHYAGNNPVKYTDPDGEEIILVSGFDLAYHNYMGKKWDIDGVYAFELNELDKTFIGQVFSLFGYDNGMKLIGKVEYSHNRYGDRYHVVDQDTGEVIGSLYYDLGRSHAKNRDRWNMGKFLVNAGLDALTVGGIAKGVIKEGTKKAGEVVLKNLRPTTLSITISLGSSEKKSSFWAGVKDFLKGLIPFKGTYDAAKKTINESGDIYYITNEELLKRLK